MLTVTIIAVGTLKEQYLKSAADEYIKRLGAYCKINIIEIGESHVPNKPSNADITAALNSEGRRILMNIPSKSYVISLCVEGRMLGSEELSGLINTKCIEGTSSLVFIIGGSWGLSDEVKKATSLKLSMSKMTFPHQLVRVMLTEQIYRAFQIINGGKYHK